MSGTDTESVGPAGPGEPAPAGRRQRLVRGGLVMTGVSVAQRLSGFAAHWILGLILFEDDFGLFAVGLGLTTIGASVRSTLQPVLIGHLEHNPEAFARTYRTTLASLWAFTLAGMAGSGLIEDFLDAPGLRPILVVLLLTMPFQMVAGTGMARISHSLDFTSVGKTLTTMAVLRHLATVLFALAGLGPMSFALGQVVATVVELAVLSRYTSLTIRPGLLSRATITDIATSLTRWRRAADRRWVWISAVALTLANSGQFSVAKLWATKSTIGVYYFAFGLTGAFWLPLTLSINTVLVPGFVALTTNEQRRARFVETISMLSVVGVLFFHTVAVTIVPLAGVLWGEKWQEAFPAFLVLSVLAPLQLLHPVLHAIERGTNQWTLYLVDIVASAVLTSLAAGVGAYLGGPTLIVTLVAGGEILVTFAALIRLSRIFGAPLSRVLTASTPPWVLGLGALAVAHLVHPLDDPSLIDSLVRFVVFTAASMVLVIIPYRAPLLALARSVIGDRVRLPG